jgi:hypothetical protein
VRLTVREVAYDRLREESPRVMERFYEESSGARTREELANAWRRIPELSSRPDYLQRRLFPGFEDLEGEAVVSGVRAALESLVGR